MDRCRPRDAGSRGAWPTRQHLCKLRRTVVLGQTLECGSEIIGRAGFLDQHRNPASAGRRPRLAAPRAPWTRPPDGKKPNPDGTGNRTYAAVSANGYLGPAGDRSFSRGTLGLPGTAIWPVPGVRSTKDRRNAPRPGQARAIGTATNFVTSSDFNRINTVRLPFL
jgi:hypothetical protein